MGYEEFLKIARVYSHWRFTKPRQNNGSPLVQIVDTFYEGAKEKHELVMLDTIDYKPEQPHITKPVPALFFFGLFEEGIIKPVAVKSADG